MSSAAFTAPSSTPSASCLPAVAVGTVACRECDALQVLPAAESRTDAVCFRCHAELPTWQPPLTDADADGDAGAPANRDLHRALALTAAALPLFVAAQLLPLMQLDGPGAGSTVAVTVTAAIRALCEQRMTGLGMLVLVTTMLLPGLRLGGAAYLLGSVWMMGRVPPAAPTILRGLAAIRPWSQLDILLVAALVAFGKLATVFHMVPGGGLPCMVAVLVLDRLIGRSLVLRAQFLGPASRLVGVPDARRAVGAW